MNNLQVKIVNKILSAIDSDDIEVVASFAETNLLKEELDALQKTLKSILYEINNLHDTYLIRQFLSFI